MPPSPKQILGSLLAPCALLADRLEAWRRLWAYTRLRSALDDPLDASVVVGGMPELQGTRRVRFGKNVLLYRDLYLETQGTGRIRIGDGVVISRGVHLVAFEQVDIEDGVMIGEYTSIRDANHRLVSGQSVRETGHRSAPVRIQRNAWIGRGAAVLSGVTVGEGAVIGANAVVTKNIPPGAVAVGVPARLLEPTGGDVRSPAI